MHGLGGLAQIRGNLTVWGNFKLTTLDGLNESMLIGGQRNIDRNGMKDDPKVGA